MSADTATQTTERGRPKTMEGLVVSNKMDKTIVVAVTEKKLHKAYKKYITRTSKYFAHDEQNQCGEGDKVRLIESRPLSKNKRWRVTKVLEKAVEV